MAARQESAGPAAPKLTPVRPVGLSPVEPFEVRNGDDDLDAVEVTGLRAEELTWTGRRRLGASRLTNLSVHRWAARGSSFVGSVLDGVEVVGLDAPDSSWWNVEVTASRIGSGELFDSSWRSVRFTRCKLGYLNLRGAQLTDVVFTDCIIEDLDLSRATAARVAFPGTRLARIQSTRSTLSDVDLRGARLGEVDDPEGLRGATITLEQLLELAGGLAARLGIRVE